MGEKKFIIDADQVSDYVVCPESWRLKYLVAETEESAERVPDSRTEEGLLRRKEWLLQHDTLASLRKYSKIVYLLLVSLVIIVFLLDHSQRYGILKDDSGVANSVTAGSQSVPTEIALLILVLGLIIFIWDLFERRRKTLGETSGLSLETQLISIKGSSSLPSREFFSERSGLLSKPDALASHDGTLIPIVVKPISSKVRDRHRIRLLMHMKVIEEVEGTKPPHGILLVGEKQELVEVKNTPEEQRWLDSILGEMDFIIGGTPAAATPSKSKCKHCDVSSCCSFSAIKN